MTTPIKILFSLASIFAVGKVFAKTTKTTMETTFAKILDIITPRDCDPAGCGYFGAPRTNHKHQGIDIVATPGEPVYAPLSGRFRIAYPYRNSRAMQGGEITNGKNAAKMFYFAPIVSTGDHVNKGQLIGYAQSVSGYYGGSDMKDHLHCEWRINGKIVDPTNYYTKQKK